MKDKPCIYRKAIPFALSLVFVVIGAWLILVYSRSTSREQARYQAWRSEIAKQREFTPRLPAVGLSQRKDSWYPDFIDSASRVLQYLRAEYPTVVLVEMDMRGQLVDKELILDSMEFTFYASNIAATLTAVDVRDGYTDVTIVAIMKRNFSRNLDIKCFTTPSMSQSARSIHEVRLIPIVTDEITPHLERLATTYKCNQFTLTFRMRSLSERKISIPASEIRGFPLTTPEAMIYKGNETVFSVIDCTNGEVIEEVHVRAVSDSDMPGPR